MKYKGPEDSDGEFVGGIGAGKGELVALNTATGEIEWKKELPTLGLWRGDGRQ